MSKNVTEIICVIDKSKNMAPYRNTVMAKFNSFIKAKADSGKDYKVSVYFFNNLIDCTAREVDINKVKPLTRKNYSIQGPSALNDTLSSIIDSVGQRLIKTSNADRAKNVEFAIFTTGKDDMSRNYSVDQVKSLISYRRDYFGWEFNFVGVSKPTKMSMEKK